MIVKGTITKLPNTLNLTNESDQFKYTVSIPAFKAAGDEAVEIEANVSSGAGYISKYNLGEVVYIGFENNDYNHPVILGSMYNKASYEQSISNPSSSNLLDSIQVNNKAILPVDTQIGDMSASYIKENIDKLNLSIENVNEWETLNTVSVSNTGTSADEVSYITIGSKEYKLAGGGQPITNYVTLDTPQTITGTKNFIGTIQVSPDEDGVQLGLDNGSDHNANISIVSSGSAAYIDFGTPNIDYGFRIIKWKDTNNGLAQLSYNGGHSVTIPNVDDTLAVIGDLPTKTSDLNNDSGFITSSDLAAVATSGSYNDLVNKPSIYTRSEINTLLNTKQDTLVSQTNIKTINGNSILGSGNLVISSNGWHLHRVWLDQHEMDGLWGCFYVWLPSSTSYSTFTALLTDIINNYGSYYRYFPCSGSDAYGDDVWWTMVHVIGNTTTPQLQISYATASEIKSYGTNGFKNITVDNSWSTEDDVII